MAFGGILPGRAGPCVQGGSKHELLSKVVRAKYIARHCGCIETLKRTRAAILQRLASAFAEVRASLCNQSRQTYAAAFTTSQRYEGVRGEAQFSFPPAALRRFRRAKAAPIYGKDCKSPISLAHIENSLPIRTGREFSLFLYSTMPLQFHRTTVLYPSLAYQWPTAV